MSTCEFDGTDFRVLDGSTVIIDSGRQNFIVAGFRSGSFVINPTATIDAYDPALVFDLGAVPPQATICAGQFQAVQSAGYTGAGIIPGYWHQIGGTTPMFAGRYRMFPGGFDARYQIYTTGTSDFSAYIDITWEIVSSRFRAVVSRYYPFDPDNGVRPPLLRSPITVNYHAFFVTFDN